MCVLLLFLPAAPSAAPFVDGCAMAGCTPRRSFASGLALPSGPPSVLFSWPFSPPGDGSSPASPGCVSLRSRVLCGAPLFAGPVAGSWAGAAALDASGAGPPFLWSARAPAWCTRDASWGGAGAQLPILGSSGAAVFWGPAGVGSVDTTGEPLWWQPLEPPLPCEPRVDAVGAGATLSSVGLTNNSRLMFAVGTAAEAFGYFANGVPDASLIFRANASGNFPSTDGLLLPIAPFATAGLRSLFLCRFYVCRTANACTGVGARAGAGAAPRDPQPALAPTPELALVALDVLDAGRPARFVLPWANGGPALAPLPADLAACVPGDGAGDGERVAATATVLQDDATLVVTLMCLNATTGAAGGPLHVRAFGVGGAAPGGALWSTAIDVGPWWGPPLPAPPPPAAPPPAAPSVAHDAVSARGGAAGPPHPGGGGGAPGLLWLAAGGPLGDARLFGVDTQDGSLAANESLSALVAAARGAACALPAQRRLTLASPLHAAAQGAGGGGALLVAVEAAAGGGAWLLGLATEAAANGTGASARLLWCAPLPGRPSGQVALARGANASATAIVLVAGSAVVGLG